MKDKLFSIINILGLAISLFAVIYIVVFLHMQFSFDKHHLKGERIYRLESRYIVNNKADELAVTQIPLGPTLKKEFPEIECYVRIFPNETMYFLEGKNSYSEDSLFMADSSMFDIFTHKFLYGNPNEALNEPFSIVLTRSLSEKYFPKKRNPVGDSLVSLDGDVYRVTAVIENVPETSHLGFKGLISLTTWDEKFGPEFLSDTSELAYWGLSMYTYILLKEGKTITTIDKGFDHIYDKYMGKIGEQLHASFELLYTPLPEIRFNNKNLQADVVTGDKFYMLVFILVAIIILIIAGINYMNLATARANTRAKEIGLRKIAGSTRRNLVGQFMSESFIFSFLALLLALLLVQYTVPVFNNIVPFTISFSDVFQPVSFIITLLLTILLGIFSGSLPALYLSSLSTVNILRGNFSNSKLSKQIRRLLVIIQFGIASLLLILLLVIQKQTDFLKAHNLGFNKENVLALSLQDTALINNIDFFREQITADDDILISSISSDNPGYGYSKKVAWVETPNQHEEEKLIINYMVDSSYLRLFQIELLIGKNFNSSDSLADGVLINQFAAEKFGWTTEDFDGNIDYTNALGKTIKYGVDPETGELKNLKHVIGVFKNYYFTSLHFDIEPLMLIYDQEPKKDSYLNIRFSGNNNPASFKYVKELYESLHPGYPFTATYIQENVNNFYTAEETLETLLRYFTWLAIAVSALGLLGMTAYTAQQSKKEIGVRKVLGTTAFTIAMRLAIQFIRWVIVANVISWPIAYMISKNWLTNFVFSIPIRWNLFALSLLITIVVSVITILYKVIKVSTTSPAIALRYE